MAGRRSIRDSYADAARLRIALRSFARHTEEITQRHGLTAQRYMLLLLVRVAEEEGAAATVTSLTRALQTTQSSVTQLVAGAVREGLVTREGDVRDARRQHLHLTPDGQARLARAFSELGPDRTRLTEVVAASSPGL